MFHNYEAPRFAPELTERKISSLFADQATDIVETATARPITVVTGAWGNGKTRYLIPQIGEQGLGRGIDFVVFDCSKEGLYRTSAVHEFLSKVPEVDKGIMALDEAGCLTHEVSGDERVLPVLSACEERGWHIVPIIAYHPAHPEVGKDVAQTWDKVGRKMSLQSSAIHLPEFRLSRDLASEFVTFIAEVHYRKACNPETLKYILDSVPYNLRLLDKLAITADYPLREFFQDGLSAYVYGGLESMLNEKEIAKVKAIYERDYKTFNSR